MVLLECNTMFLRNQILTAEIKSDLERFSGLFEAFNDKKPANDFGTNLGRVVLLTQEEVLVDNHLLPVLVSTGSGERHPSIDTQQPQMQDSNVVIMIVCQGSTDDDDVAEHQDDDQVGEDVIDDLQDDDQVEEDVIYDLQ
ncbi:hypothetical protein ACS0TY_019386 [Phlomoides rotata]